MIDVGRNAPADQVEALTVNYEELLQRQQELLEAADRAPKTCEDDETAKKLTDFVGQLAAAIAKARDSHRIEKEPHLRAGQTVDRFFNDVRGPLEVFKTMFEKLIGDWQFRKQVAVQKAAMEAERLARIEMERLMMAAETEADLDEAIAQEDAALDAAMITAARPLERSRIHGDLATGSLMIGYNYEIKNEALVPDRFWVISDKLIKDHIAAAPKDKAPEPVPGIIFTPIYKSRIRSA